MDDHTPRVFRSKSFELKQQLIRNEVRKRHGDVESVLELGGLIRDRDVFITDCLIPEAELDYCRFRVRDNSLSKCWAQAGKAKSTAHLSPVGDLHYHPETGSPMLRRTCPEASPEDEENSLRLAGLYHTFNLQETFSERPSAGGACPAKEAWLEFEIDPYTCVQIQNEQSLGSARIVVRRKEKRSYWASLIRTCDGNPEYDRSYVIEHLYSAGRQEEPGITRYDVPSVVISDQDASRLTGWPLKMIRLEFDHAALVSEIATKYRRNSNLGHWAYHFHDNDFPWQWFGRGGGLHGAPYKLNEQYLQEFIYLHADASPFDVAALLRKIAKLLESDNSQRPESHTPVKPKPDELVGALGECILLMMLRTGNQRKRRDRH